MGTLTQRMPSRTSKTHRKTVVDMVPVKLPRISLRVGLPDRAVLMLPSAPATWVYIWFVVDALLALNPKELIGEND